MKHSSGEILGNKLHTSNETRIQQFGIIRKKYSYCILYQKLSLTDLRTSWAVIGGPVSALITGVSVLSSCNRMMKYFFLLILLSLWMTIVFFFLGLLFHGIFLELMFLLLGLFPSECFFETLYSSSWYLSFIFRLFSIRPNISSVIQRFLFLFLPGFRIMSISQTILVLQFQYSHPQTCRCLLIFQTCTVSLVRSYIKC